MKKILFFVIAICFLFSGFAFSDTIKIGLMGLMSGAWASEGQEMKRVVTFLADDLNQKGGLLGQKGEVISEDDGGDPRTASLAANRLQIDFVSSAHPFPKTRLQMKRSLSWNHTHKNMESLPTPFIRFWQGMAFLL